VGGGEGVELLLKEVLVGIDLSFLPPSFSFLHFLHFTLLCQNMVKLLQFMFQTPFKHQTDVVSGG
jgi:hypothetical protein